MYAKRAKPSTYFAPTWVANSAWTSGTGAIAIAYPTGYAANDILVLCVEGANNTGAGMNGIPAANVTHLTNNNWIRCGNSNTHLLSPTVAASQNTWMDVWWRRVTSNSNTAVSIGDSGDHTQCVMLAIRGCVETGDPWDGTINVTQTTATSQVTSRNITTSAANTLLLTVITSPRDAAAAHINASPLLINNSDGVELTERVDFGATAGNGGTIGALTFRKPTAGATANVRANTVTSNVAIIWTGALKPKETPPPEPTQDYVITFSSAANYNGSQDGHAWDSANTANALTENAAVATAGLGLSWGAPAGGKNFSEWLVLSGANIGSLPSTGNVVGARVTVKASFGVAVNFTLGNTTIMLPNALGNPEAAGNTFANNGFGNVLNKTLLNYNIGDLSSISTSFGMSEFPVANVANSNFGVAVRYYSNSGSSGSSTGNGAKIDNVYVTLRVRGV
jgi:hypothetical protein